MVSPRKKRTKKSPANPSHCKYLIASLITKRENTNYAMQMKIAQKLLNMYPIDFWRYFSDNYSGKAHTSLIGFLTPKAKLLLKAYGARYDNFKKIKTAEKKQLPIGEEVLYFVDEDTKSENILDFIKKYEKKRT